MPNPIGRPMKYKKFLTILRDEEIYTPATILKNGIQNGLLDESLKGEALKKQKLRIRHSLARYSSNHFFPRKGDGFVDLPGQPPLRGWTGARWKENLE